MTDVIVGTFAIAGAIFVLLAGVGVVRFSDLYARMHAATKATTIGIALVGIAGAIAIDGAAAKITLAIAIIFVTAPSAAHVIGRAAYRAEGITIRVDSRDELHELVSRDAEDPTARVSDGDTAPRHPANPHPAADEDPPPAHPAR